MVKTRLNSILKSIAILIIGVILVAFFQDVPRNNPNRSLYILDGTNHFWTTQEFRDSVNRNDIESIYIIKDTVKLRKLYEGNITIACEIILKDSTLYAKYKKK